MFMYTIIISESLSLAQILILPRLSRMNWSVVFFEVTWKFSDVIVMSTSRQHIVFDSSANGKPLELILNYICIIERCP